MGDKSLSRHHQQSQQENCSVLIAIGVNNDGYREILGACEGLKEDTESWKNFFVWLRSRGLSGVKLITGDKAMGMVEAIGEVFPDAKYQRCTVHFYRNVFTVVPKQRVKEVARMLKAIHSQEDKAAALEKATAVAEKLRSMRLAKAAQKVEESIAETLTYMSFPMEHWTRIRTNHTLEAAQFYRRTMRLPPTVCYQSAHFPSRTGVVRASLTGNGQPGT